MKKILCFFGWHLWFAPYNQWIEEFDCIPLDNRIESKATCKRCGIKFKQQEQ